MFTESLASWPHPRRMDNDLGSRSAIWATGGLTGPARSQQHALTLDVSAPVISAWHADMAERIRKLVRARTPRELPLRANLIHALGWLSVFLDGAKISSRG